MRHPLPLVVLSGLLFATACAAQLPPIEQVATGPRRALLVNGKPFIPLMIWLQDPGNFGKARDAGINTIAGYWPGSGGTKNVVEYLAKVEQAGFYGAMPWDPRLVGSKSLLAYFQEDEPDLTHQESDADVLPGPGLHANPASPLWKLVDGDLNSWSVVDPLAGATVTVRLKEPVTATKLAVSVTVSTGLPTAREVELLADGKSVAKATLEPKRGRQEVPLAQPVTFKELTLKVLSVRSGQQDWGSFGELEAFDAAGRSLLVSHPRQVPKMTPEAVLDQYRKIKAQDPSRPVFMTLTARFMPVFNPNDTGREHRYAAYVEGADAVGFDIYPLYGWGHPDWIDRVYDGTAQLVALAGDKPVYSWTETSAGGQFVSEKQPGPTPAQLRCEVWQALCAGATGIGYFTHVWKPRYSQFGVPRENVAAMKAVNEQITRLTAAILAPAPAVAPKVQTPEGVRVDAMARELDGALYVFAVNDEPKGRGTEVTVTVAGLKAGAAVEVIDENRTVTATDGAFTDRFEPYAVHLYRVAR